MSPSRRTPQEPSLVSKEFGSAEEIEKGIKKLERRIEELRQLDVRAAIVDESGADDVVRSNVRETVREVFGPLSPEFKEHEYLQIWAGPMFMNASQDYIIEGTTKGRAQVITVLQGLIGRLREKAEEFIADSGPTPTGYFQRLNLHPRISDVASDLFMDGYHWEAVFAAAKALMNYVKERSGEHGLDGAPLMRSVFSKNNPILAFNDLASQTDQDEQEGMMHLFEGAAQAIRNPGSHTFPEGSEQRAVEYISFLSLLAYRVQESRRTKPPRPT